MIVWLVFVLMIAVSEARIPSIEGPTGSATCDQDTPDENLNNLANSSEPDCAAADAFTQLGATGVYAAFAEAGTLSGAMQVVLNDPLEPFGTDSDYVRVTPNENHFRAQLSYTGAPAGTYEVWVLPRFESPDSGVLWMKTGTTPFTGPPQNADADILNNKVPILSPTWTRVGRVGTGPNFVSGVKSEPARTITLATGDAVYVMLAPGLYVDCIALRPPGNTNPVSCPGGESENPAPQAFYSIKQWSSAPTVDGSEDAMWAEANAMPFQGTGSTVGTSTFRMLWNATDQRVCYFLKHVLANLESVVTTEDDPAIFGDTGFDVRFRLVDRLAVLDGDSYAFVLNAESTPTIWDKNNADGSSNPTFNLTDRSVASTYSSPNLIIEGCHDLTSTVTAGALVLGDVAVNEKATGTPLAFKMAHSTSNNITDPAFWATWEFSADTISGADSTAPTVGTPSCTPNESGAVCVSTVNEPATCRSFRDADNDGEVRTDGSYVTGSCSAVTGGACTCTFTGLTSPDHEMEIEATDLAGNITISAIADFSLTAPSGTTFYWDDTGGADTNNCTSTGTPCATLLGVMTKPTFGPGSIVRVRNGTYTGTNMLKANCAMPPSGAVWDGTPTQYIKIIAENERQAIFQQTLANNRPLEMDGCDYWWIEGLTFKAGEFTSGPLNQPSNSFGLIKNSVIRRNLFYGANRCQNSNIVAVSEGSSGNTFESNELYFFHRNGLSMGTNSWLVRNYANGRCAANLACKSFTDTAPAGSCGNQTQTADSGFIFYNTAMVDNFIVDNVAEKATSGFSIYTADTKLRLKFYGNTAHDCGNGFFHRAQSSGSNHSPVDSVFDNNLALKNTNTGMNHRSVKGLVSRNNTMIDSTGPGFSADSPSAEPGSGPPYTFTSTNDLSYSNGGSGFTIDTSDFPSSTFSVINGTANGNANNFSPSSSGSYSGTNTTNPALGFGYACIDRASPMAESGLGGADRGANLLYTRDKDGTLTTQKRWVTTQPTGCPASNSGLYPYDAGACVTGLNDVPGSSYYDVADRIIADCTASGSGSTSCLVRVTDVLDACVGGTY